jgi:hypothetical protein
MHHQNQNHLRAMLIMVEVIQAGQNGFLLHYGHVASNLGKNTKSSMSLAANHHVRLD